MQSAATSGQLRFRIRFDRQGEQAGEGGIVPTGWQEQFTRWADIRPLRGSEPVQAKRLTGVQPVLIVVRSDSETRQIDSAWRAVELADGKPVRYYALKTVEDMERGRAFITMMAEAGTPDGGTAQS